MATRLPLREERRKSDRSERKQEQTYWVAPDGTIIWSREQVREAAPAYAKERTR